MPENESAYQKVEIKESIHSSLSVITLVVFLLGYGLYDKSKYVEAIGLLIYILIMFSVFCFAVYKIFTLARRKVILSIDKQGVYHKDFKFMKWNDIVSIKKTTKISGDEETIFLLFQTLQSSEPYKILISDLNMSVTDLVKSIQKFGPYNIYDVVDGEW